MNSSNVSAEITVQFNDQFTKSADQALEKYLKSWKEVEKVQNETSIGLDNFFKEVETEVSNMGTIETIAVLAAFAAAIKDFPIIAGPAAVALTGFYIAWKEQQILEEWRVGDKPIDEYLKVVGHSFENLARARPLELQIFSKDVSEQLTEVERLTRQFENDKGLFLHLNLADEATEEALVVRKLLEETFKNPITQIVNVEKVDGSITLRKSPDHSSFHKGGDVSLFEERGEFQTPSTDTTGFTDNVSSFSTGIDRVPHDMLAIIHKDEAVLTKTEAEKRRQGNAGGMTIQHVSINMNVPDTFNPANMGRQAFRQLAAKMQDELRRLDRRRSL